MCGIAGYIGPLEIASERVNACLELMRCRGPDAAGVYRYPPHPNSPPPEGREFVCLLHTRLSIIDLDERSDQPFQHNGKALIFNGELYNYLEVRAELAATGRTFTAAGDTEVLLQALDQWGTAGLERCEGMWAFAYYDAATGVLWLGRDRFGEKPLYLFQDESGLYFGSEVKFLIALLGRRLPVNRRQIRRFLANGYKSLYKTRETFFTGLEELPPGFIGRVGGGESWREYPWWTPQFPPPDVAMPYEEAVAGVRERLIRSMELRLRADVPVAFCLSGGVDSNALIAIAQRALGYQVHGFTIMNTDARYEERDMVEASVRELGLRHTPIPIETQDFLDNLRLLVRQHDAPVYTITYYAQWRLMAAIQAAGYKVSVSGVGADELFSGYFDHHNAYLAAMAVEDPVRYAQALAEWREIVAPIVRNPFLQNPDYFVQQPLARDHIYLDAEWFAKLLVDPFAEPFAETCYTEPLLRNRMANELFHESVPVILHEDDLNAMYFSIENRSPFLDTALFDWCQQIPSRHLIQKGRAKAVLRDALRGLAPDVVMDNPRKVGFNAPLLDYLDHNDPAARAALMADSPVWDIVRREQIIALLDENWLSNSRSKFLFNFINVKLFLEEFAP